MLQYSPKIVQDGLVMCLDPSQNKSYPTTDLPVKNGLVMWMDAADDTTFSYSSGTTVSQWRDKSGFNYHMTPLAGSPTRNAFQNSRKVVAFTTAQDIQNTSIDLRTSPYTVFIVSRYTSPSAGTGRILTSNGGYNNWLLGHWASETNKYYANGWVYQTYAAIDTNWKLYLGDWGGSSNNIANFYAAGTALATNSTAATAGPWTLGINANSGERSNCEAAEIIVFNRLLSTAERRLVHTYLGQKWGILNTDRSIIDLSGNNDNGLLGNGTTANIPAYDYYNTSLRFDGTNDYIFLNNSQLNISTSITVEVWVKYNAQGGYNARAYSVITCKGYPWTWLLEDQSGQFNFRISTSVTADSNVNSSYSHGLNSWNHVVGTYDGSSQKIYVDGILKNSTSLTGTINTSSNDVMVGCYNYGDYCLTGNVGAVRVYSRALNATEVAQNYEAQKSRFANTIVQQGLVLNLDAGNPYSYAGAGTTWYDVSGNGKDFTLDGSGITYNSGGYFSLADGAATRSTSITSSTTCTVVVWIRTTDTQSLIFRGNDNNYYLAAYYVGSGFYSNNCGSPTYWIDTVSVANPSPTYLDGNWHMWEMKNVNFSGWTTFEFNKYPGFTFGNGAVGQIMIYDRNLSAAESLQIYNATKSRYGL